MSLTADLAAARLSVLLDLRHPLAYLALHPTLAFAEARALEVNWLPLTVPPLHAPSEPGPDEDRGVRHRRYRAQAIAREIAAYGEAQGITLRDPYRDGPVDTANLGWLYVRDRRPERLPAYLTRLFRGYWSEDLDANDLDAVTTLVDAVDADGASFQGFASGEGPAAAEALTGELSEAGLFQVPGYVIEDEVFFGRQHLPMIQWILDGRSGPVPI